MIDLLDAPIISNRLYIVYAQEDELLCAELVSQLSPLRRQGLEVYYDAEIAAGENLEQMARRFLDNADIILLLISASLLASDYCYKNKILPAIERSSDALASVILVILRACDWQSLPFANMQCLPKNAEPIIERKHRDKAWLDVIDGIRERLKLEIPALNRELNSEAYKNESKSGLHISDVIVLTSPDRETAYLDFRVSNEGNSDLLINQIELRVMEFNLKSIRMHYKTDTCTYMAPTAVYGIDISSLCKAGDHIRASLAQLVRKRSVDRFEVQLQYIGENAYEYVLEVSLHTSRGIVLCPIVNFTLIGRHEHSREKPLPLSATSLTPWTNVLPVEVPVEVANRPQEGADPSQITPVTSSLRPQPGLQRILFLLAASVLIIMAWIFASWR